MKMIKNRTLKRTYRFLLTFFLMVFATVSQSEAADYTASIRCTATPNEAVTAGVKWNIIEKTGGPYSFGETVSYTWKGQKTTTVTLTFSSEGPWKPTISSKVLTLNEGQTTPYEVVYENLRIDKSLWPLWPEKGRVDRVLSPPSFLSVGRDVVAWVSVSSMDFNGDATVDFYKTNLFSLIQKETGDPNTYIFVYKPSPATSLSDTLYYVSSADRTEFPTSLNSLVEELRSNSVIKMCSAPLKSSH